MKLWRGHPRPERVKFALIPPLLVVLAGVACRAITDKLLALQGGPEAVAAYAQLCSVTDLVGGVSLAGIGVALVAAVAKAPPDQQRAWLRASLKPCLLLSGVAALTVLPLLHLLPVALVPRGMNVQTGVAAGVGWLMVSTTLVMSYLVGVARPWHAVLWTLASFALPIGLLVAAPLSPPMNVLLGHGIFGLLAAGWIAQGKGAGIDRAEITRLTRFAVAGIAIGLLSPLCMLLARTHIASVAGWEAVGQLQAVWKVNEWVQATVIGLLYIHFLPRMAAAGSVEAFWRETREAARTVLIPAAIATAAIGLALPDLTALLYREDMALPRADAILILAGDLLRAVSWVFLYGLYARHVPRAVTIGEFLSIPLFALILWAGIRPAGLIQIGAAWALAYLAYAVFNGLALREATRRCCGTGDC